MTDDASPTPPGWYDDGTGVQRWWSGRGWTEYIRPEDAPAAPPPAGPEHPQHDRHPLADDPETIWSAVGHPLTGLGAGRYRLTAELLTFEQGMLSKEAQQIQTWEIHDVDASQSVMQRARDVGNITVHARRPDGEELVLLEDVPDFHEGVRRINEAAYAARERRRVLEHTERIDYSGSPAPLPGVAAAAPAPAAEGAAGGDLMAELERLAAFRQQGLLTDEEFTAAKRKLLGL